MRSQKRQRESAGGRQSVNKRRKQEPTSYSEQISSFHTIEKQAEQSELKGNPVALFRLRQQQSSLEDYQNASLRGASAGGETSKWLAKELRKLRKDGDPPLRLLDVGALTGTAYKAHKDLIEATSIDLNPRSADVIQADFFAYPTPPAGEEFDIVSLSLVLNFVGDLQKRGEMLRLTLEHLKPDGMLYLVLPLACVTNSRFVDHGRLKQILKAVGYDVLKQYDSAKLTYWLCRRAEGESQLKRWAKKPLEGRQSGERNNFAIVLR